MDALISSSENLNPLEGKKYESVTGPWIDRVNKKAHMQARAPPANVILDQIRTRISTPHQIYVHQRHQTKA